jgi:uncharacterized protein
MQPPPASSPPWLKAVDGGIELRIKVVPGSRSTQIAGPLGDRLKIRISQPPENGKANAAVIQLLAEILKIPLAAITLTQGHTRPEKTLLIHSITPADAQTALR